jgi:hypothetical protein
MLLFVAIPIAWLSISLFVLALCRMAARGDAMPARASATLHAATASSYSPRRPTTCGMVRRRIFTSVHNDQLAT